MMEKQRNGQKNAMSSSFLEYLEREMQTESAQEHQRLVNEKQEAQDCSQGQTPRRRRSIQSTASQEKQITSSAVRQNTVPQGQKPRRKAHRGSVLPAKKRMMKKKRAFADWLLVFVLVLVLAAAVMMTVYIVAASAPVEHSIEDGEGASLIQMQPMKRNEVQPEVNLEPVFTVMEGQNKHFLLISVDAESREEIQVTLSSVNHSEVMIPSRIGEDHIYGMLLEPGIYTIEAANADGKTVDAIVSIADQQIYSYKLTFLQE